MKDTINQPTVAPTNKIAAVGVSGALSIVIVYLLGQFGVEMPNEVASAITLLISALSGYIVPNKKV